MIAKLIEILFIYPRTNSELYNNHKILNLIVFMYKKSEAFPVITGNKCSEELILNYRDQYFF